MKDEGVLQRVLAAWVLASPKAGSLGLHVLLLAAPPMVCMCAGRLSLRQQAFCTWCLLSIALIMDASHSLDFPLLYSLGDVALMLSVALATALTPTPHTMPCYPANCSSISL